MLLLVSLHVLLFIKLHHKMFFDHTHTTIHINPAHRNQLLVKEYIISLPNYHN